MSLTEIGDMPEMKTLKPVPYQRQMKSCPKCGWRPMRLSGVFVRWFDLPHAMFAVSYCRGSMDPERDITMALPDRDVTRTIQIPCAGVHEDHLHVTCTHCKFHFLMKPRDAE